MRGLPDFPHATPPPAKPSKANNKSKEFIYKVEVGLSSTELANSMRYFINTANQSQHTHKANNMDNEEMTFEQTVDFFAVRYPESKKQIAKILKKAFKKYPLESDRLLAACHEIQKEHPYSKPLSFGLKYEINMLGMLANVGIFGHTAGNYLRGYLLVRKALELNGNPTKS